MTRWIEMNFVVSLVGWITVVGSDDEPTVDGADEAIEEHLDRVMEELDNLGAADPSIELDGNHVEFTVMVPAVNPLGAVSLASGLLRTAVHAAGGSTPDWPRTPDDKAWAVQLVSVRSDRVSEEEADPEPDSKTTDGAAELIDA